MTNDVRKRGSKWDMKEGSPEIVEISEDESLPMNIEDSYKDGDLLSGHNSTTNGDGKQLGECSDLKPDVSMLEDNSGADQNLTDRLDNDSTRRQSKASSEISHSPRMIDEEHNDNDWDKLCREEMTGNQGMDRYADGNRGADGRGTALDRSYSSRMSPGPDAWRQRSHSPSPRGGWNRSRRNRSRTRSRSRSRSRGRGRSRSKSRSRSRGRGRSRSRSPYFADRGSERWGERGRTAGGSAPPCRDFAAGRCRRGAQCRFLHEDGGRGQFEERYRADSRERYSHQSKENFTDSREQSDYSRKRQSRSHHDDGTWERSEPRRDNRSTEKCHDFIRGRCSRGASCRYVHDDSASHGGWRDEARGSVHGRGGPDSSYGSRTEHRRANKNPCKFFAEGRCRRGQHCPFLHEDAPQSHIEGSAPDEPWGYNEGPSTDSQRNYSNWSDQNSTMHATSHTSSRSERAKPASQSTGGGDSRYENQSRHVKEAGRSQYQILPRGALGSQGQNKTEAASAQQQQFLTSSTQTIANSTNNEKLSGIAGQSVSAGTSNLSSQPGINNANLTAGQSLGHVPQGQNFISQIPAARNLPITTQLQNAAPALALNSQMQQGSFPVHPNGHGQFVVPQAAANNLALNVPGQPVVPPYIGLNQQGYSLGAQALPNLSARNGQNLNVSGQVVQNLPTPVLSGPSQEGSNIPKRSQDGGTHSVQNTLNVPSVTSNVQDQNQTLQGSSALPSSSSANMVGAPISHKPVTSEEAARRITDLSASLAQFFGNATLSAGPVGPQPSQPNLNTGLTAPSSASPLAVQPNQWPWTQQQEASTVPPVLSSVPAEQQVPQMVLVPASVGDNDGNPVLLSQQAATGGHAAASLAANETGHTQSKKGEATVAEDADADVRTDGDNKKSKEIKGLKMFKCALVDFVKDVLKPTWKEGQLSREAHKTIVKKVVEKVTGAVDGSNIPQTKEKIDIYLSYSREKLTKLVQAYVDKYVKT